MQKISLQDDDLVLTSREEYLVSLEEKIMKLPVSDISKKFLKVETPFWISNDNMPSRTLLYQMLDKGVVWNASGVTPAAWTNDVALRATPSGADQENISPVQQYLLDNKIAACDIEHVFEEVNQYLEEFYFRFFKGEEKWYFYLCALSENELMKEQVTQLRA